MTSSSAYIFIYMYNNNNNNINNKNNLETGSSPILEVMRFLLISAVQTVRCVFYLECSCLLRGDVVGRTVAIECDNCFCGRRRTE